MSLLAAVPVKDLSSAKQRLASALEPAERRALAAAMLEDVLDALTLAVGEAGLLVTCDGEVRAVAHRRGVACLVEDSNRGHTEAVALAQRVARARGAERFLTIPGDVPCVTPDEIRALAGALGPGAGVAFVPSLSGFGTNGALLCPPEAMPLKFGEPSFANHLEVARDRGLAPTVLRLPGLALDVDAPEDLGRVLEQGPTTRTAALLRDLGLSARLRARADER